MSGYGGVIAAAMMGGIGGAAQAGADSIIEQQKQEAQRLRDEQLARLQMNNQKDMATFNQNLKNSNSEIDRANEVRRQDALTPGFVNRATQERQAVFNIESDKPVQVSDGSRLINPKTGVAIVDSQERKMTERDRQESDLRMEDLRARIDERNARARLDDAKAGGVGTSTKEDLPKWRKVDKKDESGAITETYWVDEKSDVEKHVLPDVEGKPGKKALWYKPWADDGAPTPAVKGRTIYTDSEGHEVDLKSVYKGIAARSDKADNSKPAAEDPRKSALATEKARTPLDAKDAALRAKNIEALTQGLSGASGSLPPGIPPGSKQVGWTKDGTRLPVYQAPDGSKHVQG